MRPVKTSSMPLTVGMCYLIFTFILFNIGPMHWQLRHWSPVLLYVPLLFLCIILGFKSGMRGVPLVSQLPSRKAILLAGSLSTILLLYPTAVVYTGRTPWQVLEALSDQKDAYSSLREQLEVTQGERGPIALIRSLFGPVMFAVVPLGVMYWNKLSTLVRCLIIMSVVSTVVLSVLRGTTRELADIVIVGGSALIISIYRKQNGENLIKKNLGKIMLAACLVAGVLVALVIRSKARAGSSSILTCIGGGYVCPAFDAPVYEHMPEWLVSALATITGYFSQGYYGLGLALDHEFIPTWGLGHSSAISSIYMRLTGDNSFWHSTYIYRLNSDAWSSEFHWSTAATWFASDVSFWGVPVIMFIVGLLWVKSWKDAVYADNDRAALFFCIIMKIIFYFPANNQMMNTFENYVTLIFWSCAWAIGRRKGRRRTTRMSQMVPSS